MPKKKAPLPAEGFNEILLYTTPNGNVKVEIFIKDETVWLTQQKIADLFGVLRPAITKHLKNIFETGELKLCSLLYDTNEAILNETREAPVGFAPATRLIVGCSFAILLFSPVTKHCDTHSDSLDE